MDLADLMDHSNDKNNQQNHFLILQSAIKKGDRPNGGSP
jgi:hypothetical protein